jgi:endonuclease/exonuclease/phosphatase family metal-dependent hydrolase
MKLITWNLDNSDINIINRMILLIDIIRHEQPDILCFQEVTRKAYDYLKNNLHYHFTEFNNEYSYRNIIASKILLKDVNLIKLSSSMNREAVHCKLNLSLIHI